MRFWGRFFVFFSRQGLEKDQTEDYCKTVDFSFGEIQTATK